MSDLYLTKNIKNLNPYDFDISSSGKVSLKPHVYKDLTNKVGFLVVHSPSCIHCVNYAPVYDSLAELANKKLFLASAFNSSLPGNEQILTGLNIEAFPTIKFFSVGGNGQVSLSDYTESRDPDTMLDYLCKNKDVCLAKKGGKKKRSPKKMSGGCGCGLTGGAPKRKASSAKKNKRSPKKSTKKGGAPKRKASSAKKSPKRRVVKKSPRRR